MPPESRGQSSEETGKEQQNSASPDGMAAPGGTKQGRATRPGHSKLQTVEGLPQLPATPIQPISNTPSNEMDGSDMRQTARPPGCTAWTRERGRGQSATTSAS